MHNHKWSLSDLENLYPFELDVYVDMLADSMAGDHQRAALPPDELKDFMKKRKNINKP